jgi:hypothetical protein
MATVRHVTAWAGRTKFQAAWFLLNRVYLHSHTPSLRGASIKERDYCTLTLFSAFWNLGLVTRVVSVRGGGIG